MKDKHESYGMIDISRYTGNNQQFFGSDLFHNGGISITISNAEVERKYHSEWFHPTEELIRIELSHNQFVDAITSGMNTVGVPCTIKRFNKQRIEHIDHVEDKKEQFQNDMSETYKEFNNRIDSILSLFDGNVGKKKVSEIKGSLDNLKRLIKSNTNFVMTCFNEEMEKTVTEAKHSISNYIDHKVHSLGIEVLRDQLQISLDSKETKELE